MDKRNRVWTTATGPLRCAQPATWRITRHPGGPGHDGTAGRLIPIPIALLRLCVDPLTQLLLELPAFDPALLALLPADEPEDPEPDEPAELKSYCCCWNCCCRYRCCR